eukprot:Pgem_evm2s8542
MNVITDGKRSTIHEEFLKLKSKMENTFRTWQENARTKGLKPGSEYNEVKKETIAFLNKISVEQLYYKYESEINNLFFTQDQELEKNLELYKRIQSVE